VQLTLDRPDARRTAIALRREFPQLRDPLILPWSEQPVIALDGDRPWLFGPIERDPQRTAGGRTVLPRRELRGLRELAQVGVPFQRLAMAHELDPAGAVRVLLPVLRKGPRTCTDAVARAVVGPPPPHPVVRRAGRMLDGMVRKTAVAVVGAGERLLDPILFGIIGLPGTTEGELVLWFPIAAWTW